MKTQGNKTVKKQLTKLMALSLTGAMAVGLSACGGGGGSKSGAHNTPSTGEIKIFPTERTAASVMALEVNNVSGMDNSGKIYIDAFQNDDYTVYDGKSSNSFCTPTICYKSCVSGQYIKPSDSCFIYIAAKNVVPYGSAPVTLKNIISITNNGKVYNLNLVLNGILYALPQYDYAGYSSLFIKEKDKTEWSAQLGKIVDSNDNYITVSALGINNFGIPFFADSVRNQISSQADNPNSGAFQNWGKAPSITKVNTIAFDKDDTPYIGGDGSHDIYTLGNGTWSSIGTPDAVITSIKHIGFDQNDTMVIQGKLPSTPSFYIRAANKTWIQSQNISMPQGLTNAVLGFSVAPDGKIYTSLANQGNTYSYTNTWSNGDGNVVDATTEVNGLYADSAGNLFAAAGDSVYEKASGSNAWVSLGKPAQSKVLAIAQGVMLTVTGDVD
ncbi:hypothetical protein [Cysteiniphilum halobium]|uniref:hypothetical protein n=1 Tax=Cysteiniphilum halobium TaxID=2219059 RepID=UPI000E657B15|nr:hypothetical protein [Cysteiniphilum halobium]